MRSNGYSSIVDADPPAMPARKEDRGGMAAAAWLWALVVGMDVESSAVPTAADVQSVVRHLLCAFFLLGKRGGIDIV